MASAKYVRVNDFESQAMDILPRRAFDYYAKGSGEERTLYRNNSSFRSILLRPRVLRDVSTIDTTTSVLGSKIQSPVCIAPTAMHKLAHGDGEVATAKAAHSKGTCLTLSSFSTTTIEEIGEIIPKALKWFQLYMHPDRTITEDLIRRAEKAGFTALVLTVDVPFPGPRPYYVNSDDNSLPSHIKLVNYPEHAMSGLSEGVMSFKNFPQLFKNQLTWDDVDWLRSFTQLPVILKGILTGDDAKIAIQHGASAVWVSNHGGRQLDGVPATIEVLSEIVQAVNGQVEVYMDGGVQTGDDVFKALALGAQAVFVGRPILWGLCCEGQTGVERVLSILENELRSVMGLSGCSKISDINSSLVVRQCPLCSQ